LPITNVLWGLLTPSRSSQVRCRRRRQTNSKVSKERKSPTPPRTPPTTAPTVPEVPLELEGVGEGEDVLEGPAIEETPKKTKKKGVRPSL
jgi:hypothetical protein